MILTTKSVSFAEEDAQSSAVIGPVTSRSAAKNSEV